MRKILCLLIEIESEYGSEFLEIPINKQKSNEILERMKKPIKPFKVLSQKK